MLLLQILSVVERYLKWQMFRVFTRLYVRSLVVF